MAKNILIVDDEPTLVKGLRFNLEQQEGYVIDVAYDGEEALDIFDPEKHDLILLDLMLPKIDGMEVCQKIRSVSEVPIIMLTAKGEDMDKILGLEYGADDYITKPFNILEVKARIKAIIRRNRRKTPTVQEEPKVIVSGSMKLDIDAKRLYIDEKEIRLTVKEFDILKLLAENPGKIYSREQLLTLIWGTKYPGDARTVDVNVRRLREKIEENPAKPEYVHTKWGMGYYFQG